jgi:hypothetical protein
MPTVRFCSKCGGSLIDGDERCRLCRTAVAEMPVLQATSAAPASDGSPFVSMWLSPRDTFRSILQRDPTYLVIPLAAVGGIFQALARASDRGAGDLLSLPIILALTIPLGAIGGLIGLYFGGALLHFTGKWLGGTGTPQDIRASIAWGTIPALWGGLLWIPIILLTGRAVFMSDLENSGASAMMLLIAGGCLLVQAGAYFWSIFTGLHSLGEAQGFSAWKALGNGLLAGLVIIVPVVVIGVGLAVLLPMVLSA